MTGGMRVTTTFIYLISNAKMSIKVYVYVKAAKVKCHCLFYIPNFLKYHCFSVTLLSSQPKFVFSFSLSLSNFFFFFWENKQE